MGRECRKGLLAANADSPHWHMVRMPMIRRICGRARKRSREFAVSPPLKLARLTKADVRDLSRFYGLCMRAESYFSKLTLQKHMSFGYGSIPRD